MRKPLLYAALSVLGLLPCCGDEESDGSNSGGKAGDGSGGASGSAGSATGGKSGSGGAGGAGADASTAGTSGTGGSSAGGAPGDAAEADIDFYEDPRCVALCTTLAELNCPNDGTPADCIEGCTLGATNPTCSTLWNAFLDCLGADPPVECSAQGRGAPTICGAEGTAAVGCSKDAGI